MNAKAHMRTIYFPKLLIDDILPYLDDVEDNETVMKNHKGLPITSRGVSGQMKKFADIWLKAQSINKN